MERLIQVLFTEHKNGLLKMLVTLHYRDGTLFQRLQMIKNGQTLQQVLGVITTTTPQSQDFTIGML